MCITCNRQTLLLLNYRDSAYCLIYGFRIVSRHRDRIPKRRNLTHRNLADAPDTAPQIEDCGKLRQVAAKIEGSGSASAVARTLTGQVLVNLEKYFPEARAGFSHQCSDSPLLERRRSAAPIFGVRWSGLFGNTLGQGVKCGTMYCPWIDLVSGSLVCASFPDFLS